MAASSGPDLVTEGCVFALDVADPRSYIGSGSSWFDLTLNRKVVTLYNTPLFSSDGIGSLSFNGTNQYGIFPYDSNFNLGTTFTLECWFNASSFSNIALFSKDTWGSNQDWGIYFSNNTTMTSVTRGEFFPNNTVITTTISPGLIIGKWYHVILSSISGNVKTYINGIQYGSFSSIAWSNANTSNLSIGCGGWNNPNTFMNGKISSIKMYNGKGFTESEVLQNFNAMRGRYGV